MKGLRSPTPKGLINESQMHRDEPVNQDNSTDLYVDEMKKGTSNIMVRVG